MKFQSNRKKLRDEIGKLHLEILRIKRGNKCELCGKKSNQLGRFHILSTGKYKRLEWCDENVLLTGWFCCHYHWHHDFYRAKELEKRIIELRGVNYKEKLLRRQVTIPKMTMFYMNCLKLSLQKELEGLKGVK